MMVAAGLVDPAKRATPQSIAAAGRCFELGIDDERGVFVLQNRDGRMWISGAGAVGSKSLTVPGLVGIEAIAKAAECVAVGFHTGRPGLVKIAKKQGYRITGYIMEKSI